MDNMLSVFIGNLTLLVMVIVNTYCLAGEEHLCVGGSAMIVIILTTLVNIILVSNTTNLLLVNTKISAKSKSNFFSGMFVLLHVSSVYRLLFFKV
jgi:hypothetical protein